MRSTRRTRASNTHTPTAISHEDDDDVDLSRAPQRRSVVRRIQNVGKQRDGSSVAVRCISRAKKPEIETKDGEQSDVVDDDTTTASSVRVDYMTTANPVGKRRVVGAPKRNRKEQMTVVDQVRAANRMARALGIEVPTTEEDTGDEGNRHRSDSARPPVPDDACVSGSTTSSDSADAPLEHNDEPCNPIVFLRSMQRERNARATAKSNALQDKPVPLNVMRDDSASDALTSNVDSASAVTAFTESSKLKPRDYTPYDATQTFDDDTFDEYVESDRRLFELACRNFATRVSGAAFCNDDKRLDAARKHFEHCGYGRSVVAMEDFDVTRAGATKPTNGANVPSRYPCKSNLRCRYDHHTFDGIPILLPIRYHQPPKNLLEVVAHMVFCSFPCALAFIVRESPRMHSNTRSERRALLYMMARKWFGVTERIHRAPLIEQHVDYGGRLTTEQFRALHATHYSFVQYPLAAAVPARLITWMHIAKKLDREKRQGLQFRVAEQHENALPPPHKDFVMDPSAPAAPRGSEARAAAVARAQRNKGQKKQRTAMNEQGQRVVVERSYVEKIIQRTAERHRSEPKKKHALQTMMNIREMTVDEMTNRTSSPPPTDDKQVTVAPSKDAAGKRQRAATTHADELSSKRRKK